MKPTKRVISGLLAVSLILGLAAPVAFAHEAPTPEAINWDDIRILTPETEMIIQPGDSFTLSVEVNAPEGLEVTYQWYRYDFDINNRYTRIDLEGKTSAQIQINSDDSGYPSRYDWDDNCFGKGSIYQCEAAVRQLNDNGDVIASQGLTSSGIHVICKEFGWDEIFIAKQPEDLFITSGDSFTLSVEMDAPENIEFEYKWFKMNKGPFKSYFGNNSPQLQLNPDGNGYYPRDSLDNSRNKEKYSDYGCNITAMVVDENGKYLTSKFFETELARVIVKRPDPDPDLMPVITEQPKDMTLRRDQIGLHSTGLCSYIPNGNEQGYLLYRNGKYYEDIRYPSLTIDYPSGEYYIIVYNQDNPQYRVQSESFTLKVTRTPLWLIVGGVLAELPLAFAYMYGLSVVFLHMLPQIIWNIITGKAW